MKLCLDVDDKFEQLFNRLSDKQKQRLFKGLSAHANAVLETINNTSDTELDLMLKTLTSAMFLLGSITGHGVDEED